jgi:hypothetical protein
MPPVVIDRHGTKEADVNALVVYESMYGNTATIGEAIAAALREEGLDVEEGLVTRIDAARTADFDLLVVGGPTHVHGMSRVSTRKATVNEKNTFPEPTLDPGLREWLARLPEGAGRLAGAFDTRFDKPRFLTGSAARGITHRLKGRGYRFVADPESFFVSNENRLLEGEVGRATTWATEIAERVRDLAVLSR